jgi:hypothetical protein
MPEEPRRARRARPRLRLVGGPDVDARIDLMHALSRDFEVCGAGTDAWLGESFAESELRFSTTACHEEPIWPSTRTACGS